MCKVFNRKLTVFITPSCSHAPVATGDRAQLMTSSKTEVLGVIIYEITKTLNQKISLKWTTKAISQKSIHEVYVNILKPES